MCNAECGKSFWNKQNENFRNKLQAKIILKKKKKNIFNQYAHEMYLILLQQTITN